MPSYLTSSSLIETVKREALIPTSQSTFTDSDFLAIANQEMKIGMLPSIMQYHEEYYVRDSDPVVIQANQDRYPIPYRAVGGKFRELFYQDQNGNIRALSRITADDRPFYQLSNLQNSYIYFFVEGNEIVILPKVDATPVGSLIFSFYMRPNELVDEGRVGTITNISVSGPLTTYTLDQIPQNLVPFTQDGISLTGFSTTAKYDVLQRRPGHKTITFDISSSSVNTVNNTITFNTADVDNTVIVGDYVAFAGECIIPQLPTDLHEVLAQRVIQRCLQALGDAQGFQVSSVKLAEMEKNTANLIENRSEGNYRKISNPRGLLRSSKLRRRNWI